MSQMPRNARGKRPQFYDTPGMDEAMSMIMVLANELMVARDRIDTIEQVAACKNLMIEAEIEAYQPDEATLEKREARRQDFLARLFYVTTKQVDELGSGDDAKRYELALADIGAD